MTTDRGWLAKGRRIAASAYRRTVGEAVQRRRSRAYMAAGGAPARDPIEDRDLAMTRALSFREHPQDRTPPARAPRTGRTPR